MIHFIEIIVDQLKKNVQKNISDSDKKKKMKLMVLSHYLESLKPLTTTHAAAANKLGEGLIDFFTKKTVIIYFSVLKFKIQI